jgi:hypothetical protein
MIMGAPSTRTASFFQNRACITSQRDIKASHIQAAKAFSWCFVCSKTAILPFCFEDEVEQAFALNFIAVVLTLTDQVILCRGD